MGISRWSGPGVFGLPQGSGDSNPTPGPTMSNHGFAVLDDRYTQSGGDVTAIYPCMFGAANDICVVDQAPATLSAVNLVAAAVPTTAVAMTLAAASTGITVVPAGGFQLGPTFPIVPAGCLCMDGLPAFIQMGTLGGGVSMYDPRTMVTRCITITSAGTDTGAVMNLVGYDWFGQRMTQQLTMGSSGSPVTTLKAFKFFQSATPVGSLSGSNVSLGTSDVYGFQLAAWDWASCYIVWNNIVSTITGFTAAVATSPSTNLLGDVRGTYGIQTTASNGTRKLQMFVSLQPWNLTQAGTWGVPQV